MDAIAIIPARGGSKRIPRKNIKNFCGRPMISYAIKCALESRVFSKVIVSTEDSEIAEIALSYGAECSGQRPSSLSDDIATTSDVMAYEVSCLSEIGISFRHVCCIYPCVPFLQPEDLISSFKAFRASDYSFYFSISEYPSPPQRALVMDKKGIMRSKFPEFECIRTQDLELQFFDAGQFYWGTGDAWINGRSIHNGGYGYLLKKYQSVDIDDMDDWNFAESISYAKKILLHNSYEVTGT